MANYQNFAPVPQSTQQQKNAFDLSRRHLTTHSLMTAQPIAILEAIPGGEYDINVNTFMRLRPMPSPAFTSIKGHNRLFFVPFRVIMPQWNDFITDSKSVKVPSVALHIFSQVIINSLNKNDAYAGQKYVDTLSFDPATALFSDFDIIIKSDSRNGQTITQNLSNWGYTQTKFNYVGIKLNWRGAHYVKVIESLGYRIPWNYSTLDFAFNSEVSVLPLLAYFRVYLDYYQTSQFLNNAIANDFDDLVANYSPSKLNQQLEKLIDFTRFVAYDKDYFTSSWSNPYSPSNNAYGSVSLQNAGTDNTISLNDVNAPSVSGGSSIQKLTDIDIRMLKRITDYFTRNQLAGSRAVDRYLLRYGKRLDFSKFNRSVYIDDNPFDVNIGDVVSTSDTEGASLGTYAGKGLGFGQGENIPFSTDEFGYLLVVSTVQPRIGYFQGFRRHILHTDKFDFFTPEFDGLGVQAVTRGELYAGHQYNQGRTNPAIPTESDIDKTFGYQPRYSEYKMALDDMTGDFSRQSYPEFQSWHTFRAFGQSPNALGYMVPQNINETFSKGGDSLQFKRLFYTEVTEDQFIASHDINIRAIQPAVSLYDINEFNDRHQSSEQNVPLGGTQMD